MTSFWTDKRVLITGGAGYLACSLLHLLKDRAAEIVRLDRPGAVFFPVEGTADIRTAEADIRDPDVWKNLLPAADVIFHLAAQTSAPKADADPAADRQINVAPVAALIETCRRMNAHPSVVFSGTATECGLTDSLPVDESVPDHPVTAYDRHKLEAENLLKEADAGGILQAVTLRLANLYGPGPRSSSADRGILNLMIRRALAGEPLTVYGTGEYIRDYLFVEDAARAFLLAAEHIAAVRGGHYVIGSGTGHAIRQALERVAERVSAANGQPPVRVTSVEPPVPLTPIETRDFIADSSRFQSRTGWRAEMDLREGIDRTVSSFIRHGVADRQVSQ